jgi:hypothetical protein
LQRKGFRELSARRANDGALWEVKMSNAYTRAAPTRQALEVRLGRRLPGADTGALVAAHAPDVRAELAEARAMRARSDARRALTAGAQEGDVLTLTWDPAGLVASIADSTLDVGDAGDLDLLGAVVALRSALDAWDGGERTSVDAQAVATAARRVLRLPPLVDVGKPVQR